MNTSFTGKHPATSDRGSRVFRQGDGVISAVAESEATIRQALENKAALVQSLCAGWRLVGLYVTRSGKVGLRIERGHNGQGASFRYTGEWGAGSGDFASVASSVKLALRCHKHHRAELAWADLALLTPSGAQ